KTLLTTVVSEDPMYGYFDVDEHTVLRYQQLVNENKAKSGKQGEGVEIHYGLGNEGEQYPHKGKVDFVNNQLDSSTGTMQVRVLLDNPPPEKGLRLLTPGLFVRFRVPLGQARKMLLVPQAAVGTDQGKKFLFVVNDKDEVEYRPVTLGAQQPDGLQV